MIYERPKRTHFHFVMWLTTTSIMAAVVLVTANVAGFKQTAAFALRNRYLKMDPVKVIEGASVVNCIRSCQTNDACKSVNYDLTGKSCEILPEDACHLEDSIVEKMNSVYYHVKHRENFQTIRFGDGCSEETTMCSATCLNGTTNSTSMTVSEDPDMTFSPEITSAVTTSPQSTDTGDSESSADAKTTTTSIFFFDVKNSSFTTTVDDTFWEVKNKCTLVTMETDKEYKYVSDYLDGMRSGLYYVGIWCKAIESVCRYSATDALLNDKTYWASGYPKDPDASRVAAINATDKLWRTVSPWDLHPGLCYASD